MINQILNDSLDVFKLTYKKAFLIKLIETILPYLLIFVLVVPSAYIFDKDGFSAKIIIFLSAVLSGIVVLWCMLAQWVVVYFQHSRTKISYKDIWLFSKSKLKVFLFANLMLGLVMFVVALPGIIVLILFNESSDFLKLISYILIGIPVSILFYRGIFLIVIVIVENLGVFEAFDRSLKLSKSNTLLRWMFFYIVLLAGVNALLSFAANNFLENIIVLPQLLKFSVDFIVSYLTAILIFNTYIQSSEKNELDLKASGEFEYEGE